jgi:hypothetical protein
MDKSFLICLAGIALIATAALGGGYETDKFKIPRVTGISRWLAGVTGILLLALGLLVGGVSFPFDRRQHEANGSPNSGASTNTQAPPYASTVSNQRPPDTSNIDWSTPSQLQKPNPGAPIDHDNVHVTVSGNGHPNIGQQADGLSPSASSSVDAPSFFIPEPATSSGH